MYYFFDYRQNVANSSVWIESPVAITHPGNLCTKLMKIYQPQMAGYPTRFV